MFRVPCSVFRVFLTFLIALFFSFPFNIHAQEILSFPNPISDVARPVIFQSTVSAALVSLNSKADIKGSSSVNNASGSGSALGLSGSLLLAPNSQIGFTLSGANSKIDLDGQSFDAEVKASASMFSAGYNHQHGNGISWSAGITTISNTDNLHYQTQTGETTEWEYEHSYSALQFALNMPVGEAIHVGLSFFPATDSQSKAKIRAGNPTPGKNKTGNGQVLAAGVRYTVDNYSFEFATSQEQENAEAAAQATSGYHLIGERLIDNILLAAKYSNENASKYTEKDQDFGSGSSAYDSTGIEIGVGYKGKTFSETTVVGASFYSRTTKYDDNDSYDGQDLSGVALYFQY